MKRLTVFLFLLLMAWGFASAQPCPGEHHVVAGRFALVSSSAAVPGPLYGFIIQGGLNCNIGIPWGPLSLQPQSCRGSAITTTSGSSSTTVYYAYFSAVWPNETARINAGDAAGCSFICGGSACQVRGSDALPVELMGFSIDEDEASK